MEKARSIETRSLVFVYGTLILASLALDFFSHGDPFWAWKQNLPITSLPMTFGLLFTVAYIGFSLLFVRLFQWAAALTRLFSQLLTPLSYFQIVWLSILSGFVEEWFFRGILLNHFGLVASSITFAFAHFLPARSLWVWSLITFFGGLCFGKLYQFSGSLILVSVIHGVINGIFLLKLNRQTRPALFGTN